MNKISKMAILAVMCAALSGCGNTNSDLFKRMDDSEKEQYVLDYLDEEYNLSDVEILTMDKRSIGFYTYEDDTYVKIEVEPNNWFNLWVTDDGEVQDTYFALDLRDAMNSQLENIFREQFQNCKVWDNFRFCDPSSKKWEPEELDEMIKQEELAHLIFLFIPTEDRTDSDEDKVKELKEQLKQYDCGVYIFYCDDIDNVDYSEINYQECDLFVNLAL